MKPPEPYLTTLISELHSILSSFSHEILIQTEPELGYAVSRGVRNSKGETLIIMDSDGSHSPSFLPSMLSTLASGYDIVIGSKSVPGASNRDSLLRSFISLLYNKLTCFLLHLHLSDPMSGFIVAHKSIFKNYSFPPGFKFMLPLYASHPNLKIAERPIIFQQRKMGQSKVSVIEGIKTIFQILQLKGGLSET